MPSADPIRLLHAWECAASVVKPLRGVALLEALDGMPVPGEDWPLTRVDAALVAHRNAWFGPLVPMLATCPDCGADFELQLDLSALEWTTPLAGPVLVSYEGKPVEVRPPCTTDVIALAHVSIPEAFADGLFARCVVGGPRGGGFPAGLRALAADALSRAGHGPRTIDLGCGACGAGWQPLIDVAGILWTEIDARARRLLHEVHRLAAAFHWSERDILALSPARRDYYLTALA